VRVISVNTGRVRPLRVGGRDVPSGIGKAAVNGPVAMTALGLAGDEQADLSVHGGLDKAVYAYPAEHLAGWQRLRRERGVDLFDEPLRAGAMGENLTLEGLLETDVWVGDEFHFPDCTLRVTAPREPCFKFNAAMGMADAARRMIEEGCCGFYLAVVRPGHVTMGQTFRLQRGTQGLRISEAIATRRPRHLR
jgi:MOSC domain-containing protein YiiM